MGAELDTRGLVQALLAARDDCCRLCFGNLKEGVLFLVDEVVLDNQPQALSSNRLNLADILTYVTQHEIDDNAGLPESVCLSCANSAINAYLFLKFVQHSADKWAELHEVLQKTCELPADSFKNVKSIFLYVTKNESNLVFDKAANISDTKAALKRAKVIARKEQNKRLTRIKRELNGDNFICEDCGKRFFSEKMLNKHKEMHRRNLSCNSCGKKFDNMSALNMHVTRLHTEKTLQCTECAKMFPSEVILNGHMKEHHTYGSCKFCGKTYNMHSLRKHEQNHTIRVPCPKCKKIFRSKDNLRVHARRCVDGCFTNVKCDYTNCSKSYTSRATLLQHVRYAHGRDPYQCTYCGKKYMDKNKLYWHLSEHTGNKNFQCNLCKAYFRHPNTLTYHMRSRHTGERPFPCDECDEKFITSFRRLEHKRRHHGAPAPECDICKTRFTTLGRLKRHIKKHYSLKEEIDEYNFVQIQTVQEILMG